LLNPLLIFHKCDAHESLAIRTETSPGGNRHICLFQEPAAEIERAHVGKVPVGHPGPDEHAGLWRFHVPADLSKALDEDVAAFLVDAALLVDELVAVSHCDDAGDLDGGEVAVVVIPLDRRDG